MDPFELNAVNEEDYFAFIADLLDTAEEEKFVGVSRLGRAVNIYRDGATGATQINLDYFCEEPTYPKYTFKHRFRVARSIVQKVCDELEKKYGFFKFRNDAYKKMEQTFTKDM